MKFLDIFWNRELHRLRLFWRLTFYILFISLSFFLISLLVTLTGSFALFNSRIGKEFLQSRIGDA